MRLLSFALCILLAGCLNSAEDPVSPPDPAERPETAPVSSFRHTQDLVDCPDIALVMQAPIAELQALLPAGFQAGEAIDFHIGLSPLADFQTETGLTPTGAVVLFIQQCAPDEEPTFMEGYAAIYVLAPAHPYDLPDTGLNFVALQHGASATWLPEVAASTGWPIDMDAETTVSHQIGPTARSTSVTWINATGPIATVSAGGLPAHPPATYDARVRLWQPLDDGMIVYDHLAAGNMYPAVQISCEFAPDSAMASVAGQPNCAHGVNRLFEAFILEGHDPTLEISFFPE